LSIYLKHTSLAREGRGLKVPVAHEEIYELDVNFFLINCPNKQMKYFYHTAFSSIFWPASGGIIFFSFEGIKSRTGGIIFFLSKA